MQVAAIGMGLLPRCSSIGAGFGPLQSGDEMPLIEEGLLFCWRQFVVGVRGYGHG